MAFAAAADLKRNCVRNIGLHWLLSGLAPNYHSIADFRKLNPKHSMALIMTVYNMKRAMNILGMEKRIEQNLEAEL